MCSNMQGMGDLSKQDFSPHTGMLVVVVATKVYTLFYDILAQNGHNTPNQISLNIIGD